MVAAMQPRLVDRYRLQINGKRGREKVQIESSNSAHCKFAHVTKSGSYFNHTTCIFFSLKILVRLKIHHSEQKITADFGLCELACTA